MENLTDDDSTDDDTNYYSLFHKSFKLNSIWDNLSGEYLEQVDKLIHETRLLGSRKEAALQLNKVNLKKLTQWSSSPTPSERTVIVEVIGTYHNSLYVFKNIELEG